jgi:hypothetical protein
MVESLAFFGSLVLIILLNAVFGADSRDGDDWVKHLPV